MQQINQEKLVKVLVSIFVVEWIILAIEPNYRSDWVLENMLVFIYFGLMIWARRHITFSSTSYLLMFIFLFVHEIGAHYTYAEVPYDEWFKMLTGGTLNELLGLERNHFDRVVHFAYGLLLFVPIREVFIQLAGVRGFWSYFFSVDIIMSSSMLYEVVEWGAANIFGGDLGMAYLGTQGDIWDSHKDMALASAGAVVAMFICLYGQRNRLTESVSE